MVPGLAPSIGDPAPQDVVFLIDVSGSMAGASLGEAQAALRLCLRHLRAGDRFNIIAFQTTYQAFTREPVAYTQPTLEAADAWVQGLWADGGTELLAPLMAAVQHVQDGVVVLLTDGQVGNEDEILRQVLAARGRTRLYAFGIGTNVSDALLRSLAQRTGGAVEFIHPGERIDEKVVTQFARAMAPRVTDVTLTFHGDFEVSELAPDELPALVDGEPWEFFAHLTGQGSGYAELHGQSGNAPFALTVSIDAAAVTARPFLVKCWAAERICDFEAVILSGRRAERMRERIIDLAVQYGLASRYTSFLVIEQRPGARRAAGQPETRVVPVHLPAGWAMFEQRQHAVAQQKVLMVGAARLRHTAPAAMARSSMMDGALSMEVRYGMGIEQEYAPKLASLTQTMRDLTEPTKPGDLRAGCGALFSQQLASGLWEEGGAGDDVDRMRTTARVLLQLWRAQVTTGHRFYGAQVRKAIEAVSNLAGSIAAGDAAVAAGALGVALGRSTKAPSYAPA